MHRVLTKVPGIHAHRLGHVHGTRDHLGQDLLRLLFVVHR
jgi:hypothetical protein